jgi:hypothetical protein
MAFVCGTTNSDIFKTADGVTPPATITSTEVMGTIRFAALVQNV